MRRIKGVTVAILTWNGRHHLETCLPALEQQHDPGVPWKVLVLDNGSTDGTSDWLARHHPNVDRLYSAVNLGFCAGYNRLVEASGSEAVVLLNNDTKPQPQWLAALVDALACAPADVAAVSGQIVDWQGDRLDFARGVMTFDGHAFQRDFGRPLSDVDIPAAGSETRFACGGNMIIRRESYLRAGGFDAEYFAYLEDVDLGWRLWAGGERILFEPEARVHHRSMATSQLLGNDNRGFLFERNAFLTAYKNFDDDLWQRMMPAVWLTLVHRTQTLTVQNNPAGDLLTVDPYAGLIANTASPSVSAASPSASAGPPTPASPVATETPQVLETTWGEKWRGYGPKEFFRRAARKASRAMLPNWLFDEPEAATRLTDPRTVAQYRALTYLLGHLDQAAARRRQTQARRQRSDREIFERFPLAIIPTYPGDRRLFESQAFESWLPGDLPFDRFELGDIMAMDDE